MDVNVRGTRNVVQACLENGVGKLVHTSSVAALGFRGDRELIDETATFNRAATNAYKESKHLGESEVLAGVGQGLDAVMINPTVVIGQRDVHVHGGQIVRDAKRGRIPAYIRGGMNVVDVDDVVRAHIAAASRGRKGERYIAGGMNLTHREVFTIAARVVGARPPLFPVPIWALRSAARIADAVGTMTGRQPWITPELVSSAGRHNWYSSAKAERELGYRATPIEEAMRRAYEWYINEQMM
jgi:dihydroflavonol-4-reductase